MREPSLPQRRSGVPGGSGRQRSGTRQRSSRRPVATAHCSRATPSTCRARPPRISRSNTNSGSRARFSRPYSTQACSRGLPSRLEARSQGETSTCPAVRAHPRQLYGDHRLRAGALSLRAECACHRGAAAHGPCARGCGCPHRDLHQPDAAHRGCRGVRGNCRIARRGRVRLAPPGPVFAAGTLPETLAKARQDGWGQAEYAAAREVIQRVLGPWYRLFEGDEGFAPAE